MLEFPSLEPINFYDNILNGGIPDIKPVVHGSNNLFVPPTTVWGQNPLVGVPVYTESPVGPLATGSIGKDQAEVAAVQVAYDE
ncbi:MAG TPA: hypothetical protein VJH96_04495 [Patescibacteria group bacterium]|nr:hypothetical protein [Patescibacteria group bacterium]